MAWSAADTVVDIEALTSVCIGAAERAITVIREVNRARSREGAGTLSTKLKIDGDPKSAATIADLQAEAAIMAALLHEFGPGLTIVGEEGTEPDTDAAAGLARPPLARDLLSAQGSQWRLNCAVPGALRSVPLSRVTVFVDPLDGTAEFVKGNVQNCQCLIGIAVDGEPVAGVVGLPYWRLDPAGQLVPDPGQPNEAAAVVLAGVVGGGIGGAGQTRLGLWPSAAAPDPGAPGCGPIRRGLVVVAASMDAKAPLPAVRQALGPDCKLVGFGASGNKFLQVLLGNAGVALLNFKTSLWDTAAHQALLVAVGGTLTDLFGNRIVHTLDRRSAADNVLGVIATAAGVAVPHHTLCARLRSSGALDALLAPLGRSPGGVQAPDISRDVKGDPLSAAWLSELVIAGCSAQTPAWSAALGNAVLGYTSPEATAVRYKMSSAVQIKLELATTAPTGAPTSLFYKRAVMRELPHALYKAENAPEKLVRDIRSYQVEITFLGSQACRQLVSAGVRVPKVYSAVCLPDHHSPINSKFALLLEDFSDGWEHLALLGPLELASAARELATIHARFFRVGPHLDSPHCTPELQAAVWPSGGYWGPDKQPAALADDLVPEWDRLYSAFEAELQLPSDRLLADLGARLKLHAATVATETHVGGTHRHSTLIHGDAKAGNLFFRPRGGGGLDCSLIDFQWTGFGLGATDVAYLIVSSAGPAGLDLTGAHEKAILVEYHRCWAVSMVDFGVVATVADAVAILPLADLEREYESAVLDLCTTIIAYHWALVGATPSVLNHRGAKDIPCNSYNKNLEVALWLMRRCDALLRRREQSPPPPLTKKRRVSPDPLAAAP